MNLPNFKDILKIVLEKLSLLKSNLPVMISIIIALVAILLFIPTQLLSSGLKKEITQESIEKLLRKIENVDVISEDALNESQELLDKVAQDVNVITQLSIQTTKREYLKNNMYNVDPNDPNSNISTAVFSEFGQLYCGNIDQFIEEHNATIAPTQDEIEGLLEEAGIDDILRGSSSSGRNVRRMGTSRSTENDIQGMMVDQICKKRAAEAYVYIDPFQISGYDFWSQYKYDKWEEDIKNCWYSQLGFWIIEDVLDTIVAMNKDSENLLNAPVKRLMKVKFTNETSSYTPGDTVKIYSDRPEYVLSTIDTPKETLTGRYSDEDYDVVHFKTTFVVETKKLPQFFNELCSAKEHKYIDESNQIHNYKHNQITILDMIVKSVNMKAEEHGLYRYGDTNVSEVELTCEYLFNYKGYEDVIPTIVVDSMSEY